MCGIVLIGKPPLGLGFDNEGIGLNPIGCGDQIIMGLLRLADTHSFAALNRACAASLLHGAARLSDLRRILEHPSSQNEFQFLERHPLIRNLAEYGLFIKAHA